MWHSVSRPTKRVPQVKFNPLPFPLRRVKVLALWWTPRAVAMPPVPPVSTPTLTWRTATRTPCAQPVVFALVVVPHF